jgi:hypothetical protein
MSTAVTTELQHDDSQTRAHTKLEEIIVRF